METNSGSRAGLLRFRAKWDLNYADKTVETFCEPGHGWVSWKMASKTYRNRRCAGVSLVEVIVATCVLAIVFMGHSKYRCYATLDAHKAAMQTAGARAALLFCESWRAAGGIDSFDPVSSSGSELAVLACPAAEQESFPFPEGFTPSGVYEITLDGDTYYVGLSWKQVSDTLRALNIKSAWAPREPSDPGVAAADKSYVLTAYASSLVGW